MVVYAFVDYLALTGDLNPDMTITLSVNGNKMFSEHVTKDNWQQRGIAEKALEGIASFVQDQV
jgi:hypothetical protein